MFWIKTFLLGIAIVLALDDYDVYKKLSDIEPLNGEIEIVKEISEAILCTRGHVDQNVILRRYTPIFMISFAVVGFELQFEIDNYISACITGIGLGITVTLRNMCNQKYDKLKNLKL